MALGASRDMNSLQKQSRPAYVLKQTLKIRKANQKERFPDVASDSFASNKKNQHAIRCIGQPNCGSCVPLNRDEGATGRQ